VPLSVVLRAAGGRTAVRAKKDGDSNVLDRPDVDKKSAKDKQRKMGPIYKLMLHNDNYNRREYVVKTLLRIVDVIKMEDAIVIMQEAHETGIAMVTACAQEEAEKYCQGLRNNGLIASIEPDGNGSGGLN